MRSKKHSFSYKDLLPQVQGETKKEGIFANLKKVPHLKLEKGIHSTYVELC